MNKYEWIETVMATKLSTGTKVFAFGLYTHMDQAGQCYPGDEALIRDTGMSRGHFSKYRRALAEAGYVNMEERPTKNGKSYSYTISLHPMGNQSAPNGKENAPNGKQSASNGCRNTYNNTTNNTDKNTFRDKREPVQEQPSFIQKHDAGLEHLELLLSSKGMPAALAAVARERYLDSEYLPNTLGGRNRAGLVIMKLEKDDAA